MVGRTLASNRWLAGSACGKRQQVRPLNSVVRLQMARGSVVAWIGYGSVAIIAFLLGFMAIAYSAAYGTSPFAFSSVFAIPILVSLFLLHQTARLSRVAPRNAFRRACLVTFLVAGASLAIGSMVLVIFFGGPHLASLALYGLLAQLLLVAVGRYAFAT
jgi:NADH:ubiquinone oxidoreductase subunit 2 (subunit N)